MREELKKNWEKVVSLTASVKKLQRKCFVASYAVLSRIMLFCHDEIIVAKYKLYQTFLRVLPRTFIEVWLSVPAINCAVYFFYTWTLAASNGVFPWARARQLPPRFCAVYPLPAINCALASKVYFFSTKVFILLRRSSWPGRGHVLMLMGIFFGWDHLESKPPPYPLQPLLLILMNGLIFSLFLQQCMKMYDCSNALQIKSIYRWSRWIAPTLLLPCSLRHSSWLLCEGFFPTEQTGIKILLPSRGTQVFHTSASELVLLTWIRQKILNPKHNEGDWV